MPNQSDFPVKWACETPQKNVKFEVRVPKESLADLLKKHSTNEARKRAESRRPEDYTWIEIPVTSAELWIEKGEAARIQRTAKIKFPTEWGENTADVIHNSPRRLITRFDRQRSEQFMFARISFKHPTSKDYVLNHLGWVGGVGQSGDEGVSKLWVYDVAEMLEGVFIGTQFNHPTVEGAVEKIARLVNDNTPIPLSDVDLWHPETEEEFAITAEKIGEGLGNTPATTYQSLSLQAAATPKALGANYSAIIIDTGINLPVENLDTKTFEPNHDTLRDVFKWFENKTASKLHFEPAPDGNSVVLVADVVPSRRRFFQKEVVQKIVDEGNPEAANLHDTLTILHNNALYEIKPFNTLYLRGDTSFSERALETVVDIAKFYGIETRAVPSKTYPVVKVQVPALLQAAEGVELAPELIESDAESLDAAEQEAISEFRQLLEEETEGQIKMLGNPLVMPYDRVDSFEACGDHIEFEPEQASYEIEGVKHSTSGGQVYKTRLTVSVWANDDNIEIVESKMEHV